LEKAYTRRVFTIQPSVTGANSRPNDGKSGRKRLATLTLSVSPNNSPGDPHSSCAADQYAAYTIVDAYAIVVAGWIQFNAVPASAVASGLLTNGSPIKTGVLVE